MLSKTGACER
jgi:hypothetical protein